MPVDTAAVLVAAGRGRRVGGTNKALLELAGAPLVAHALRALTSSPSVAEVVVVMDADDRAELERRWSCTLESLGAAGVVDGGAERWLSSRAGCTATDASLPLLLVHDCARPLVCSADVEAVLAAVRRDGSALLAEPLADTLKESDDQDQVRRTVPREHLWRASTPQAARRALLLEAFAAWPADGAPPTDECALLEAVGATPRLVAASAPNPKITRPPDLPLAEALLAATGLPTESTHG